MISCCGQSSFKSRLIFEIMIFTISIWSNAEFAQNGGLFQYGFVISVPDAPSNDLMSTSEWEFSYDLGGSILQKFETCSWVLKGMVVLSHRPVPSVRGVRARSARISIMSLTSTRRSIGLTQISKSLITLISPLDTKTKLALRARTQVHPPHHKRWYTHLWVLSEMETEAKQFWNTGKGSTESRSMLLFTRSRYLILTESTLELQSTIRRIASTIVCGTWCSSAQRENISFLIYSEYRPASHSQPLSTLLLYCTSKAKT